MSKSELPEPGPESPAGEAATEREQERGPAPESASAREERDPRIDLLKAPAEPESASEPEAPAQPEAPGTPEAPPAPPQAAAPFPSAAPPQPPPPPLPAGGWASVPPSAVSGLQPAPHPPAPHGNPYPYPYPYPPAAPSPAPTNGLAVAALVTGLVLAAPVALVLGIVALTQIKRRREHGFGMAVAGVVLGAVGTVVMSLVLGAGDFSPRHDDDLARSGGGKAPAGAVHWSELKAGDCYNDTGDGVVANPGGDDTVYWVRRVPCAEPHHGEVAGGTDFPTADGSSFPGETVLRSRAAELCRPVLDEYALDQWAVPDGMDDVYLYPTRTTWGRGDRRVTCAFEDRDEQHVGTVRTDRRSLTAAQLAYLEAARGFNRATADQPSKDPSAAPAEYRDWARRMANACRAEATALDKPSVAWPAEVAPKVAKLAAAKEQAAGAWSDAASGTDLPGDIRRAEGLQVKSMALNAEIRRGLGLSTGEQVPDLRV
ncbi:DUF4190 domain-containing protein [Streptomyces rubellomurinus]|uniref:DUF4190 domain-containing protein n=1 Tax=Streptomyces rubellomurinus (strain ATCC 31215) TaxID=359131 RepID=UPI0012FF2EC6|nr:DUF4190 domain-containing protein [Streptomyces rubellomurinus]